MCLTSILNLVTNFLLIYFYSGLNQKMEDLTVDAVSSELDRINHFE